MKQNAKGTGRGKWVAIVLVAAGIIAALAGWKFRVTEPPKRFRPVATQPAIP